MFQIARLAVARLINDHVDELKAEGGNFSISYVDFDGAPDIDELPEGDCIGLVGFGATQYDKFNDLVFGVAVVVQDDKNLFRMTRYVDLFYSRLIAEATFDVYHPESGDKIGKMVVFDGTAATPVTQTTTRSAVSVQASARLLIDGLAA